MKIFLVGYMASGKSVVAEKLSQLLGFSFVDTDKWIGNGNLIPSGPLREKLDSLKKYDGVFLKNDNKIPSNKIEIIKQ